jgi:replicative DNA helicase
MVATNNSQIRVFYSYSHKDEQYREQLEEHLSILRRKGLINEWSDRKITGGQEWRQQIEAELSNADLIILLISPSFIASDFCYTNELARAISRHEIGEARVVPVFVRKGSYDETPFAGIQGFPKNAKPISLWGDQDEAWTDVVDGLKKVIEELNETKHRPILNDRMRSIQNALVANVEAIDRLYNEPSNIDGAPTGIAELDKVTSGLKPGDLFVIGARPSIGKTNLALNIAVSVARAELPVVIFSTKLRAEDVSRRILSSIGRLNYVRTLAGNLGDDDWPRLTAAIQVLNEMEIMVDDSPVLTVAELKDKCLRQKKLFGALPLVVLDSVQYLELNESSAERSSNVGKSLKTLARELNTTFLVTTHVSRQVEARPNKRPVLADIFEAPGLGDEADVVLFLYRDEIYNSDTPERGTAELIVAKNHFGPVCGIRLVHLAQFGKFESYYVSPVSSETDAPQE